MMRQLHMKGGQPVAVLGGGGLYGSVGGDKPCKNVPHSNAIFFGGGAGCMMSASKIQPVMGHCGEHGIKE